MSSQAEPAASLEAVPEMDNGAASSGSPGMTPEEIEKLRKQLPPGLRPYRRLEMPTPEQLGAEEFMNNCAVRTVMSGVMGMGLGVMFGLFMGTMDGAGLGIDGTLAGGEEQKKTARQVAREMMRTAGSKSWSYAKGFGAMGAMFAGSECVIEKVRAKHDMYNSIYAGCATGAALAYSGGPKAMCFGCATFAAFSAVIDRFMGH